MICERGGHRSWTRVFSDARTARKTSDSTLAAPSFLHTDSNNEVILLRGIDRNGGWATSMMPGVGLQIRQTHQERIPWGLTRGIYELSFRMKTHIDLPKCRENRNFRWTSEKNHYYPRIRSLENVRRMHTVLGKNVFDDSFSQALCCFARCA